MLLLCLLFYDLVFNQWLFALSLTLYTQDQNLNSHLLPLFIFYRSGWGEVDKISSKINSSCVIMSIIFRTTLFFKALILQGEI